MRNEIDFVIDKSRRAIKSAKREYKAGEYDYACSRAYYAAFYLLEGVLLLDKKRFTKHSAVISVFNKDYVKTAVFPTEISKHIKYLLKRREIGDYSFSIKIDEEDARNCIFMTEEIFKTLSDYLKKRTPPRRRLAELKTNQYREKCGESKSADSAEIFKRKNDE